MPDKEWVVGNKFLWNSRANEYVNKLYSFVFRMPLPKGGQISIRDAISLPEKTRNALLPKYLYNGNAAIHDMALALREVILERYRKENIPELASRSTCIWVCQKKTVKYLIKALQLSDVSVFKLRLNGVIHLASENLKD